MNALTKLATAWAHTAGLGLAPMSLVDRVLDRRGDPALLRWLPAGPLAVTADPGTAHAVLTDPGHAALAGSANTRVLPVLLAPRSVFLTDGEINQHRRDRCRPPLAAPALARHHQALIDATLRAVGSWPVGRPFPLLPRMRSLVLENLVPLLIDLPEGDRRRAFFGHAAREMDTIDTAALLTLAPHIHTRRLAAKAFARHRDPLTAVIRTEIDRRRGAHGDSATEPLGDDLLSHLLAARDDQGRALSQTTVCDDVLSALVALRDVLAVALTWGLERLAHHRLTWDQLRASSSDDAYAHAVTDEVLRVRPPVLGAFRILATPTELGHQPHPAGRLVMAAIPTLHHRAELYSAPHRFLPERFTAPTADRAAWIPFGAGPRRCLGEDLARAAMRSVLTTICAHTRLRPAQPHEERPRLLGTALILNRLGRVIQNRP